MTDDEGAGEYFVPQSMRRFIGLTVEVAPALQPVLDEHMADYGLLPHLYFADVSRWVTEEIIEHRSSMEVVAALLHLFEWSYPTADDDVQNVIDVSFVEMVQDEPEVVRLFGPILASRVDPEYRLS